LLESSTFNVFGLTITSDDINRIFEGFERTYNILKQTNPKWSNISFCKSQVIALWENISSALDKMLSEKVKNVGSEYLTRNLTVNSENEDFLRVLGKATEGGAWLISRFENIDTTEGSINLYFKDTVSKQKLKATINLEKIRKPLRKYVSRVKNTLSQFVDWVLLHKKTIVSCILVAGLVTITIIAGLWIGSIVIPFAKFVIPFVVSLICLIAEYASFYEKSEDLIAYLKNFMGISIY